MSIKIFTKLQKPIIRMIDVGYTGSFNQYWICYFHHISHLITFNPIHVGNKYQFPHMAHSHYELIVSDRRDYKPIPFNVYEDESQSSVFAVNPKELPSSQLDCTIEIETVRLDSFEDISQYNFLQTDAQGSDLAILLSLGEHIDHIWGIQVEVLFKELYIGAPLLDQVHSFLVKHGFFLVKDINMKPNPQFGDYVYINTAAPQAYIDLIKKVYNA